MNQPPVAPADESVKRPDSRLALKMAQIGVWEMNPLTNQFNGDERCLELLGLLKATSFSYEQAIRRIHSHDRERVNGAIRRAMIRELGGSIELTCRIRGATDEGQRQVRFTGGCEVTDVGEVHRLAGVVQDVTNFAFQDVTGRKQNEAALRESEARIAADLAGMRRLYELQSKLSEQTDVRAALEDVLAVACEFTGTDRGCVQLLSADGERLEMAAWQGYADDSPFIDFFRYEGLEEGCEVARVQRQRLIIEDTVGFAGLDGTDAGVAVQADDIRASQATPMTSRSGETIGVVATQFRQPHRSSDHELRLMDMLAWTAGEFLERHRADVALRESEANYRTLFNEMDEGYGIAEVLVNEAGEPDDYRVLEANPQLEKLTGMSRERLLSGQTMRQIAPEVEEKWYRLYGNVALTGVPLRAEELTQAWNRWYDVYVFRIGDPELRRVAIFYKEITERKRREANGAFLAGIVDDLSGLSTADDIIEMVGARIGAYLSVTTCQFVDVDEARGDVHVFRAWNSTDGLSGMRYQTYRISEYITDDFAHASNAGKSVIIRDVRADSRMQDSDLAEPGVGAFVTVPFHHNGVWTNYLAVTDSKPRDWREDEVELVREVANRVFPRIERVRTEASLRSQEERTRIAIESADMGTWEWNLLTDEVYWNEQHFRLFGMEPHPGDGSAAIGPRQPLTSADFTQHVHPDDRAYIKAELERTIREKTVYDAEFRAVRDDGTIRWMNGYGRVTAEQDGQITRLSGVILDIDDRRQAHEATRADLLATRLLQELGARLTTETDIQALYQEITRAAIVLTGADAGTVQLLDPATQELVLLATQGVSSSMAEHFYRVNARSNTPCGIALARNERSFVDFDVPDSQDPDGSMRRHVEAGYRSGQSTPLITRSGKPIGMVSTHWCAGHHRPAERELRYLDLLARQAADLIEQRQSEATLREADRRKDEFLATLAHELRNPLAPISNTLHILQLTAGDNQMVAPAVDMMSRQVRQLVRLVDDLLDVSRISQGKVQIRLATIDLGDVVRQAIEATRPLYESGGRELTVSMPPAPLYIQGDTTRLIQVVSNLLNNAAKFTAQGGKVGLTVERTEEESDRRAAYGRQAASPAFRLRIRDNGTGLAADQLERIFELFVQADNTLERSSSGLGLGLTLVRQLVELHGGWVNAQSDGPGQGSEFTVHLPAMAELVPQPASGTGTRQGNAGRRILVIDDNQDAATTLAMLLTIKGHQSHTQFSGQAGIAAAESGEYDVILLDIGMPGLNGYDTGRLIRRQPWGQSMRLVALTGFGQDEDKRLSREAGFDAHLVKPVDLEVLLGLIDSLVA